MYCHNCGANAGIAKFCPECGSRIPLQDQQDERSTGTLTLRKYKSPKMQEIVADIYIDGEFKSVISNADSTSFTLPAGTHELLIHADSCVDALQNIQIDPLENRLCLFSVDDVGIINIVQQGNPSRSAAYAGQRYTDRPGQGTGYGGAAVAYQDAAMPERYRNSSTVTRSSTAAAQAYADDAELTQEDWDQSAAYTALEHMKYCKFCGSLIHEEAVVCPNCGRQVEELRGAEQRTVIHNLGNTQNVQHQTVVMGGKAKDKWVAFLLCFLFGVFGVHKFYEGRIGMGILYIFTFGLFGIGWMVDLILILLKPNPYYV